jgi:hypothetical protein
LITNPRIARTAQTTSKRMMNAIILTVYVPLSDHLARRTTGMRRRGPLVEIVERGAGRTVERTPSEPMGFRQSRSA